MNPVHLLSLSLDSDLLDPTSAAFLRQQTNTKFFSHTTILILNYGKKLQPQHFNHLDIIPVNAWCKLDLLLRTFTLARKIHKNVPYQLINCDDPLVTARVGKWLKAKLLVPLNVQDNYPKPINFWKKYIIKTNLESANSFISPIIFNLDSFYKPTHYRPAIKKFISIGKLISNYKYADLIQSFSQITKAHPESTLTIIGDGSEKNILASHIINLGLNDRIFLLGEKTSKDIAALLHQHDVFVFTGQSIGWGEVICQAQASGLPVIASPTVDGEDILQPNINCLTATDTTSLVSCLLSLTEHPEEVYRLAKNGQQWLMANLESNLLPQHYFRKLTETMYLK